MGARRGRAGRRAGVPLVEEALTGRIIGAAMEVHRALGPGLLESAYAACLAEELSFLRIPYRREVPLPVVWACGRLPGDGADQMARSASVSALHVLTCWAVYAIV